MLRKEVVWWIAVFTGGFSSLPGKGSGPPMPTFKRAGSLLPGPHSVLTKPCRGSEHLVGTQYLLSQRGAASERGEARGFRCCAHNADTPGMYLWGGMYDCLSRHTLVSCSLFSSCKRPFYWADRRDVSITCSGEGADTFIMPGPRRALSLEAIPLALLNKY